MVVLAKVEKSLLVESPFIITWLHLQLRKFPFPTLVGKLFQSLGAQMVRSIL